MDDGDSYELDDGDLVETPTGAESQCIAMELLGRIDDFLDGNSRGTIVPPAVGLDVFPKAERRLLRADGGFILWERLGSTRLPKEFLTVAPDLAIESISPFDTAFYLQRKVQEYLSVGVRLVWVLWPDTRMATVYRADGSVANVYPSGELDGEDVIPGFRCALADIMPAPVDDDVDESNADSEA